MMMVAGEKQRRRGTARDEQGQMEQAGATPATAPTSAATPRRARRQASTAPAEASATRPANKAARKRRTAADESPSAAPAPRRRQRSGASQASQPPRFDRPAIAPCAELDYLRALSHEEARAHVDGFLHAVMPREDADAFEASCYRWELHLVEIKQLCLVHGVDIDRKKLRRYRTALTRGASFPPLIGLGGEGQHSTEDVLLCDGYHRAFAMRDTGLHFVWMWLAVSLWESPLPQELTPVSVGC